MALSCLGTIVGYSANDWTTDEGEVRVSHKLTVSTGDAVEVISLPELFVTGLGADRPKLAEFGRPVLVSVQTGAFGDGRGGARLSLKAIECRFLTFAELHALGGGERLVYSEAPLAPASGNGSSK